MCYRHYISLGRTRGRTEGLGPHTWGLYTTGVSLSHDGASQNESRSGVGVESGWSQVESRIIHYESKWS